MAKPICYANSRVSPENLQRVQARADEVFTEAHPVVASEMLSQDAQLVRQREICEALQSRSDSSVACYGLSQYAQQVTDLLRPPIRAGLPVRTLQNIGRLFESSRVETDEIVDLIEALRDPTQVSHFRELAQEMFLGHELFYYDYIPHQGAVMCYMPRQ